MDRVTSDDGTGISFSRTGDGPALVLVHGTGVDRHVWDDVIPALGESFTVFAIDRRGRGESGDADDYAVGREFEDLTALATAVDGPVNLLGHSYGAICAIGAAPQLPDLRRLILYEPPLWRGDGTSAPSPTPEQRRMEALAERGEKEAILETYWTDLRGEPHRLDRLRSRPDYRRRVSAAHTLPREMGGRREFRPTPESYPEVAVPTLLLTGSETDDRIKRSVDAAADLFSDVRRVEIEGHGHAAMNTAPDRFVAEVIAFLAND
ncbi:alpha/beta fold hydrolase [Halobium palmae]|uniref:Alpha/beta fold hydrolase n=1 Tax=Halobium palmae TaxID=1776492 RepID=A0ABD5RXT9_9EURY